MNLPLSSVCAILSLPLLLSAWYESNRKPVELAILTLSAVLLNSASLRGVNLDLLGTVDTSRLLLTNEINMLVAIVFGIYSGIMRRWIAATAALVIAFAWFLAFEPALSSGLYPLVP